ncbi:conserved hypothetical protein [Trichinella spiralis]|uniref:hypothetical protein n=1 Tax=Trichinella spiralis TaxID=6334 RepID=UPI0001EFBF53|nr:conserved hypothetical protein [Trichinella spiralis]
MIRITLERKALNANATPKFSFYILSTIEDQLLIFLVALMLFVDTDRIKLITHKWRTNANIKERDVHSRVNLKQLLTAILLCAVFRFLFAFKVFYTHLSEFIR